MPLSRERMREYQRKRRARLKGDPVVRLEDLEKRVSVLEKRVSNPDTSVFDMFGRDIDGVVKRVAEKAFGR